MKSLFYTSLIFAGAMLLLAAFFPRGRITSAPGAPMTRGETESLPVPHGAGAGASATPGITHSPTLDDVEPKVETLEELTKNWTVIPPSAFPRQVKLLREAVFKSPAGSSKLPAGTSVLALACDKGVLNLATDESSPVRGMARVGDTDLKTRFDESYAKWAAARLEMLRKQQAEKRRDDSPEPVAVPGGVDEAGKPVRKADGTYPVLVASMKSGQVTDITPKKIKMWGTPTDDDGRAADVGDRRELRHHRLLWSSRSQGAGACAGWQGDPLGVSWIWRTGAVARRLAQ